jgi:hypothetical protein
MDSEIKEHHKSLNNNAYVYFIKIPRSLTDTYQFSAPLSRIL